MPLRKYRLSRTEQGTYLAAAQELVAFGLDVEISQKWLEASRTLDIAVADGLPSLACESPSGVLAYAVCVRLVARSRVTLVDCQIATKWDDQILLESFDARTLVCRSGSLEYPRSEILNERIEKSLRFHYRGQMVEGMILASGLKPVPNMYPPGTAVPYQLTFTDSLGNEMGVEAKIFVERTAKRKNAAVRTKNGTGLHGPQKTPESSDVVVRCAYLSDKNLFSV